MPFSASSYPKEFRSTVDPIDKPLVSVSLSPTSTTSSDSAPIFIITLLSIQTPDNRLTPQFLTALLAALQDVESAWDGHLREEENSVGYTHGAALVITGTTSGPTSKFFSNGLDFAAAISDPNFFDHYLFPVYETLMTFPIPVVASVGAHAFAAGAGLACACDYAIMGKKGYMCMNEIEFGAQVPPGLYAPLSTRIHIPSLRRRMLLEGERFSGSEALKVGLIDQHFPEAESAEVLEKAVTLAMKWAPKARKGVWGENKKIIKADALTVVRLPYQESLSKL